PGQQEKRAALTLDGGRHTVTFEFVAGGQKLRPEAGEPAVAVAAKGQPFRLLAAVPSVPFSDDGWEAYAAAAKARHTARDPAAPPADRPTTRRPKAIDRLLADERWADHWVSYWQDVLAENPGLLKPTLNNTGPFRFWIYQALADNLPADRFATELIRMEGSDL